VSLRTLQTAFVFFMWCCCCCCCCCCCYYYYYYYSPYQVTGRYDASFHVVVPLGLSNQRIEGEVHTWTHFGWIQLHGAESFSISC